MFIFFDLIFFLVAAVYLPIYLFRKKFHAGLFARIGFLPKNLKLNRPIWIHAVSVGEAMALRGLAEELRKIYPDKKFVISTVTATGNKIAQGIAKEGDLATYLPLDLSFVVKSVIDRINPSLFIIAETEIWPNLISYLYKKRIPVVTVNGRISDSSFFGYQTIKFFIKPILNKVNLFCVQTERDARRLKALGVEEEKIKVSGNMKFDAADYMDFKKTSPAQAGRDYTDFRQELGLGEKDKLWVAGSTHSGEDEIILHVYKSLLPEFANLKLLIAPRHPERAPEITNLVKRYAFEPVRISLLNRQTEKQKNRQTVFILDTIGQLMDYYAIAEIVFVGGSLVKVGGHNILEPAALGKPVLFGPHMFNFRDIADLFLINKAAVKVNNQEELKASIKNLLFNSSRAAELGETAKQLILKNQGVTLRNAQYIRKAVARL